VVSLPSGQQVVNTSRASDIDLPRSNPVGLPPDVLKGGATVVSNLFSGPATHRLTIAVTVPVVREGRVTQALHLGVLPEALAALPAAKKLPAGWAMGLVGSDDRIITRSPYVEDLIGQRAPDWYVLPASSGVDSGMIRGRSLLDGAEVYGVFKHLTQAPWTLALIAPETDLARIWQRPLMAIVAGGIAFASAILAMLLVMGRRIADPINALAGAARAAVAGGAAPHVPESRVREISELRSAVMALSQKQILLREASHRIKNGLQLVSSTLGLQRRGAQTETLKEEFRVAQAHIQAIARLHELLYRADRYDAVDACDLVRAIGADIAALSGGWTIVQVEAAGAVELGPDRAGPFAVAVAELITNAVKHASRRGRTGTVNVRCRIESGTAVAVTIRDDGPGLPPDFDLAGQRGLGLRMCLALAAQIGGTLQALPADRGAVFELRVPTGSA
jgi:two-component sensor histidine kinase